MKYIVKKVTTDDEAIIANEFLTELIHDEKKYDSNINELCVVNSLYEKLYKNPSNVLFIAKSSDEKIVGYLYGYIRDDGDAYIEKTAQLEALFVLPTMRNNGVANSLLKEFKKWCYEKSISIIILTVCYENNDAIKLYEKNGFKTCKYVMKASQGE